MTEDVVGVGPWPGDLPVGDQYDPELLGDGDRRNVVDRYRYWTLDAIVADLDLHRHAFHVAIENWQHDFNIGSVVRTANAFLAAEVHIVGRRRWNRRGAMVTDRYQHIRHHPTVADLVEWAATAGRAPGSGEISRAPGSGEIGRAPGSGEIGRAPGSGQAGLPIVGIDVLPGAVPLEITPLPERCLLLF